LTITLACGTFFIHSLRKKRQQVVYKLRKAAEYIP
jgi:hypothetical protein